MINPKINNEFTTQKRRRSGISITIDTDNELDISLFNQTKIKQPATPRKHNLSYFQKIVYCWYK